MRKLAFLACVLTMLPLLPACAQDVNPIPFSIRVGGGISFPIEPDRTFSQSHRAGYHILGGVGYSLMPLLEGYVKGEFHSFGEDLEGDVDGGNWEMTLIGLGVQAGLGAPGISFRPYAFGGIGLAWTKLSEGTLNGTTVLPEIESESSVYFDVGAGAEWSFVPQVKAFIQGRYVYISTDQEQTAIFPVTLGLRLF